MNRAMLRLLPRWMVVMVVVLLAWGYTLAHSMCSPYA